MAKSRHGKLRDITIKEISLVDLPANKLPFLFFKCDGDPEPVNKQNKIEISIVSDGTVGGTSVSVNGKKLGKLKSFDFSLYGGDPKQSIYASYTKAASDSDGFNRTETYYLNKGDNLMKEQAVKALKSYLGVDDIDSEKRVSEEDIEKALTLITKEYKESFPEDLADAIGVIAKSAVEVCGDASDKDDVSKAGAKFSKDALKKLKDVLSAIEALKAILPDTKDATAKSEASDELTKQIAQLSEQVSKIAGTKESTDKGDLTKALDEISTRLKTVEESGATKKSIEGDGTDDNGNVSKGAGEDGKALWPTITEQG